MKGEGLIAPGGNRNRGGTNCSRWRQTDCFGCFGGKQEGGKD